MHSIQLSLCWIIATALLSDGNARTASVETEPSDAGNAGGEHELSVGSTSSAGDISAVNSSSSAADKFRILSHMPGVEKT